MVGNTYFLKFHTSNFKINQFCDMIIFKDFIQKKLLFIKKRPGYLNLIQNFKLIDLPLSY